MKLHSSAFGFGMLVPQKYTCKGADISPPISWEAVPEGAKGLAIICDDPDAPMGDWTHWAIYNLPPTARSLAEGVAKEATLPDGSRQGLNDFDRVGYNGPCPPPGTVHHYRFTLYALDRPLALPPKAAKRQLLQAMTGHILAQAELIGTFKR